MFGSSWIFRVGSRINSVGSTNSPFPRTLLRIGCPIRSSRFLHFRSAMILLPSRQWRSTKKIKFIILILRIMIRMLILWRFYIFWALWWRAWLFHQGILYVFTIFSKWKALGSSWKKAITSCHMAHIICRHYQTAQKWLPLFEVVFGDFSIHQARKTSTYGILKVIVITITKHFKGVLLNNTFI